LLESDKIIAPESGGRRLRPASPAGGGCLGLTPDRVAHQTLCHRRLDKPAFLIALALLSSLCLRPVISLPLGQAVGGRSPRPLGHGGTLLPHGEYLSWVQQACGLKPQRAAELVKAANWAQMSGIAGTLNGVTDSSVLFLLSADISTPGASRAKRRSRSDWVSPLVEVRSEPLLSSALPFPISPCAAKGWAIALAQSAPQISPQQLFRNGRDR
jgi:hypothetical protein